MDQARAQTLIITTMALSGALVTIKAASEKTTPTTRQVVGIGVAGIGLSALATVASPQLAGGLSLLWLTGAVFLYGGPAIHALQQPLKK